MKPSTCSILAVVSYLLCIGRANNSVISTPVNLVAVINETFEDEQIIGEGIVPDQQIWRSFGAQIDSADWITSRNNWITSYLKQVRTPTTTERYMLIPKGRKCSRYCIERNVKNDKGNFQYISLFWSINGTNITDVPNISSKDYLQLNVPELNWTDDRNLDDTLKNCQIYLELDCNIGETGSTINNINKELFSKPRGNNRNAGSFNKLSSNANVSQILAHRTGLTKYTETKLFVNDKLQKMMFDIDGNLSCVVLRIPINATALGSRILVSLAHKNYAEGVKIDTYNAPPGEWCVKLTGVDDSKYDLTVETLASSREDTSGDKLFFPESMVNDSFSKVKFNGMPDMEYPTDSEPNDGVIFDQSEISDDLSRIIDQKVITTDGKNWMAISSKLSDGRKIADERSSENPYVQEKIADNVSSSPIVSPTTGNILAAAYIEHSDFANDDGKLTILRDATTNKDDLPIVSFAAQQHQKIRARSSIDSAEDLYIDNRTAAINNADISMKIVEPNRSNQELSEELANYAEDTLERKKMLIDVNRNSNLLVTPGTIHRLIFDVMNNCILPVRYAFGIKSAPFRVYNVQPAYAWIYPRQTSHVAVDLVIPGNIAPDTTNTVTLSVQGTEIKEKSAYLYVQGSFSKINDDIKPTIEYAFNNNCAGKMDKNRCYKSHWSLDLTIQDYDSGLKRVVSTPNEIYPRTDFVSGTRNPTTFYYSSSCCDTTVKITAIDLFDNYQIATLDVAVWNNLSDAEIAAISVGALLILLLLVLIIILIIYCLSRKKSQDLPYTQRYGSRSPAQTERTNF